MTDGVYAIFTTILLIIAGVLFFRMGMSFTDFEFSRGERKVFAWSNVSDLNAELAKGWTVIRTYDVTNNVLGKKYR